MQRTLVLIKPDAVQRGLAGRLISRLERRGLKMVALKMLQTDRALAQRLYAIHEGKPFFEGLVDYICSGPILAAVFEGVSAVEVVRRTMGETDPAQASSGTIRGDLALDIGRNLVHGSDSMENAQREIGLFFTEDEVLDYPQESDRWISG